MEFENDDFQYTHEEVIKALNLIRNICGHNHNCSKCPFNSFDNECLIGQTCPSRWKIKCDTVWKALDKNDD